VCGSSLGNGASRGVQPARAVQEGTETKLKLHEKVTSKTAVDKTLNLLEEEIWLRSSD
jgi:hypothetical protein